MPTATRRFLSDFQAAVAARSNAAGTGNVYTAVLNTDNVTLKISRVDTKGVTTVLFSKVIWNVQGGAPVTDDSGYNGDSVIVYGQDTGQPIGTVAADQFLNTLT